MFKGAQQFLLLNNGINFLIYKTREKFIVEVIVSCTDRV